MTAIAEPAFAPVERTFLGHPIGLAYLAFTEAWERFSFYGMQALLVLYMVDQLLRPAHVGKVVGLGPLRAGLEQVSGPLSVQALASQILGLYAALVYLTPVFGGMLRDRLLGRRTVITAGAVLMAAGHFLMISQSAFLLALALLIAGCGLVKGNIASQVGGLYAEHDPRRSDAFQIYTMAINAGVIAAPLVCGTLGQLVGWDWGFGAACVGMLIGLCIYLAGRRHLPPDTVRRRGGSGTAPLAPPLGRAEWRSIAGLLALMPILAVAFVGNNQIFNVYMIWARESADLTIGGFRAPVTWLLSYDAVLGSAASPWRCGSGGALPIAGSRRTNSPSSPSAAPLRFSASPAFSLAAAVAARTGARVSLPWLLAFHVINTLGYVNILPVALALCSRAAPAAVNATMIGVFYLLFFAANLMVGWIGGLYETMSHAAFWGVHAGLCAASTLALLLLYRPLKAALG
jgi:proton-dependent oligopeptide transporter, POT family